jgi:long-chain acyl-CoA synthetase
VPLKSYADKNPGFSIMHQAKTGPGRIAAIDHVNNKERVFSYQFLEERIQSLTGQLIKLKVTLGDRIAVISKNRVELVEIFSASMRIGAMPFCINPSMSSDSISSIFKNASPCILFIEFPCHQPLLDLASKAESATLIAIGGKINGLLDYDVLIQKYHPIKISELFHDIPSLITYTSGSTGEPKGVVRKHFNYGDAGGYPVIIAGVEVYRYKSDQDNASTIVHQPPAHGGVLQAMYSIGIGSKTIIIRDFDPSSFLKALHVHKIVDCIMLPSMLTRCLREISLINELDFSQLKLITLSGASCSPELMQQAKDDFQCQVYMAYGMTEGDPKLTFDGVVLEDIPISSCGKANVDESIKLIDSSGNEGEFGEMWFKNEFLMEGYYNRADLTSSKYHEGWFMTGDIFYRDKKGFYYYRGRKDDMFICDGENIYPLEIENILCKHESVLFACVVAIEDDIGGQVPAAMVTCKAGYSVTQESLRKHYLIHGVLYAYPRIIEIVDILPTLGPGKVDRQAVKNEIKKKQQVCDHDSASTQIYLSYKDTEIEFILINILCRMLKLDYINKQDSIFDLGIGSIEINMFLARIQGYFYIELTQENIIELQSPIAIARHLKNVIMTKKLTDNHRRRLCTNDDSSDTGETIL